MKRILLSKVLWLVWIAVEGNAQGVKLEGLVPLGTDLEGYLARAGEGNAGVLSAKRECEAAGLDVVWVKRRFWAPEVKGAVGMSEDPEEVPLGSWGSGVESDSSSVGAGVEVPLVSGVYGGAGARFQRMAVAGEGDGDGITAAGGHVRVPLLRDRGFCENVLEERVYGYEEKIALYGYEGALLDAMVGVTEAYAQYLYRVADGQEISNALGRAEQLVSDTASRAELKDIAEYQVYPAQYEAATREEELAEAKTQVVLAREGLREAIGVGDGVLVGGESAEDAHGLLMAWVEALAGVDVRGVVAANEKREVPEVLKAEAVWQAMEAREGAVREAEKASLDLTVGAGWRSEADATTLNEAGYAVSLVYARSFSQEGRRAKEGAARLRAEAAQYAYAAKCLEVGVRKEKALARVESVLLRRELVGATVEAARRVLEAETERFAIGDGSSRAVLDAQNYLTTARRRELSVSLDVIVAMAEMYRALGLSVLGE